MAQLKLSAPNIKKRNLGGEKLTKYLQVNSKDNQLLLILHDFVYLDAITIDKYVYDYAQINTTYNRLKKLEEYGYIKSHRGNAYSEEFSSNMYTLDKKGVNMVRELQGEKRWETRWTNTLQPWYMHNIYISRVYFRFKEEAEKYGIEVDFVHEQRAYFQYGGSKDNTSIRPDGFLVLSIPDNNVSYVIFLEMERSLTRKNVVVGKLDKYEEFINSEEYRGRHYHEMGLIEKVEEYIVLFIALDEQREQFLKRIFNSMLPKEGESITNAQPDIDIPVKLTNMKDIERDPLGEIYNDVRSIKDDKGELF